MNIPELASPEMREFSIRFYSIAISAVGAYYFTERFINYFSPSKESADGEIQYELILSPYLSALAFSFVGESIARMIISNNL